MQFQRENAIDPDPLLRVYGPNDRALVRFRGSASDRRRALDLRWKLRGFRAFASDDRTLVVGKVVLFFFFCKFSSLFSSCLMEFIFQ